MARTAPEILMKTALESLLVHMDFSDDVAPTESIASITSVSSTPTGLTLGTPVYDDDTVQLRVASGTAGITYTVSVQVLTDKNTIFVGSGQIQVT
jgi:hypothetical protein